MEDAYFDLVNKVEEALQKYNRKLILGESGPYVSILHYGKHRYYRISFTSRTADGGIVIEDPVEIYAGLRSEPRSIEQNDTIVSQLEEKLMNLHRILH